MSESIILFPTGRRFRFRTAVHLSQSPQEQFFMFPRSTYPLTPAQLRTAIDQRKESTVYSEPGESGRLCQLLHLAPRRKKCISANVHYFARFAPPRSWTGAQSRNAAFGFSKICCQNRGNFVLQYQYSRIAVYPKLGFIPFSIEERVDWNGKSWLRSI